MFFANKMDIAGCLSPFECCASLGLDDIKSKPWHITYAVAACCCCAHLLPPRYNWIPDSINLTQLFVPVTMQSLLWTDW
eukprot:COSAG02_NODE_46_length_45443_cov_36.731497_21_plen_79_part_00